MINAVLFDLDGTLGDTLPLCIEAFRRSIAPLCGRSLSDEEIIATFGPSEQGTIRQLIPEHYDAGIHSYWNWYRELHAHYPHPFPGMIELLDRLRTAGVFLGMVTGKARESAVISLDVFGLENYFAALAYGSEEGPCKDRRIRALLEEHALRPEETVYVGDAPSDIFFARKAGVPIISAAWATTADYEALRALQPDQLFTSIAAFSDYILGASGKRGNGEK